MKKKELYFAHFPVPLMNILNSHRYIWLLRISENQTDRKKIKLKPKVKVIYWFDVPPLDHGHSTRFLQLYLP